MINDLIRHKTPKIMLDQLFGSKTRVALLKLFFENQERPYFVRELTREIGAQINSVRRELENLVNLGILRILEDPPEMAVKEWEEVPKGLNRKKFYQLSKQFVLHEELSSLFAKSHLMLEKDLMDNLSKIDNAYLIVITGFFTLAPDSTTDILIVGNVNKKELAEVIGGYEKKLKREINYTVLPLKEFEYRREITDKFLYDILVNKRIVLVDKIGIDSTEGR